jgi:aminocarboxymuconate-semialdehyde decarboxylase
MLINLHAHELTYGMFGHDPHWGPLWVNDTLKIGDWQLGTKKKISHPAEKFSHENQRKAMKERGIDKLVVSQPAHMFMYWAGDFATKFSRIVNDELSTFCAADPEHFDFWALVPMADPAEAPRELTRAVEELGAVGMMMGGSNFAGREVYDPAYEPLWQRLCELDVPVFVHGYNASATGHGAEDPYDASSIVGMNFYETLFIWYIICSGVLDRYPDLRFYVTHAGGFFPFHLGRFTQTNPSTSTSTTSCSTRTSMTRSCARRWSTSSAWTTSSTATTSAAPTTSTATSPTAWGSPTTTARRSAAATR